MDQVKSIIALFALLVAVLLGTAWISKEGLPEFLKPTPTPVPREEILVEGKAILVEVVDTPEKRAVGLSGRDSLGEDEGMLFAFEELDTRPGFWMKGMRFAIDILWIDDGKVVQISQDLKPPEPDKTTDPVPIYAPSQAVDYVIEVKDDFVEKNNLKVGSEVDFKGALD